MKLPSFDPQIRRLKRLYSGERRRVRARQHRAHSHPAAAASARRAGQKVVMSGMGNKFELWSQEAWDAINAEDAEALRADGLDLNGALESLAI